MLKYALSRVCIRHSALADHKEVRSVDRETFLRLMNRTASLDEVKNSLDTIMRVMYIVYQKPVILLIDEYDVPLAKAEATKSKEFYTRMLDVIRGIMSTSLKTNEYLNFAVITGCLRISMVSRFMQRRRK